MHTAAGSIVVQAWGINGGDGIIVVFLGLDGVDIVFSGNDKGGTYTNKCLGIAPPSKDPLPESQRKIATRLDSLCTLAPRWRQMDGWMNIRGDTIRQTQSPEEQA